MISRIRFGNKAANGQTTEKDDSGEDIPRGLSSEEGEGITNGLSGTFGALWSLGPRRLRIGVSRRCEPLEPREAEADTAPLTATARIGNPGETRARCDVARGCG